MNILFHIYLRILYFFSRIYHLFFPAKMAIRESTILNKTDEYISKKKNEFTSKNNGSSNIESIFYKKDDFFTMIREQNNDIEEIWKTRILIENTPRGNIVMFYDAYKQGFAYYSDTNSMPYVVLNSVAMKYVSTYFCRDFFVDNEGILKENESPLLSLYYREPVKIKDEIKSNNNKIGTDTSAFAKLKNYNKPIRNTEKLYDQKNKSQDQIEKKVEKEEEIIRNKFIYLGKMVNFPFLKKEKKVLLQNGFKTNLLNGVNTESQLQKQVLNYKDFKAIKDT